MSVQTSNPFAEATRQFADAALKANTLALGNAERLFGLHVRTLEERLGANIAFLSEAADVRSFDDVRAIWPKGVEVARGNVERFVAAGQDAVAETIRTNEEIGQLVKSSFEAAGADVGRTAPRAGKAK
ncbi:phasin family protein [Coralloluteibacterium thermophilus]|uniref:Phasin family protein n=1 Tax=Coralloluteibacterium thermophilum TaxID=2707049 RepID=A0ABV9NEJ0_9GAMM